MINPPLLYTIPWNRHGLLIILGTLSAGVACFVCQILYRRRRIRRRADGRGEFNPVMLEEARLERVHRDASNRETKAEKEVSRLQRILRKKERELKFAAQSKAVAKEQLESSRITADEQDEVTHVHK